MMALLCASLACHAGAAVDPDLLPAPGLYRVDSLSSVATPDGAARSDVGEDGASGDTSVRTQVGAAVAKQFYKGAAPLTHCVQPQAQPAAFVTRAAASCPSQSTQVLKNGFIHTSLCNGLKTTVTVHKLGSGSWDVVTRVTGAQPAGPAGVQGLQPLLEHMAQHAPTAEQRAKAAAQLAQLPAMQATVTAQRAQTADQLKKALAQAKTPEEKAALRGALAQLDASGMPVPNGERHEQWTRISNTCLGVEK
jgi:hypothetical protein